MSDTEIWICTVSVGGRAVAAYTCRRDADREAARVGGTVGVCPLSCPEDIEHSIDMDDEMDFSRACKWGAAVNQEWAAEIVAKHIADNFDKFRPSPYPGYTRVLHLPSANVDLLKAVSECLFETFDTLCKVPGGDDCWLDARRRKMTKAAR
jgi:hypothetical protein